MSILKIPIMEKEEYDRLIGGNHISRIAFKGDSHPYVAPFMYIFDGKFMYFLSTNYGKKIELFKKDPNVAVEIEEYSNNMSNYQFVTLQGRISEIKSLDRKNEIKGMFVDMIDNKELSTKVMAVLGYSPDTPFEAILGSEKILIWKLVDVKKIVALKNP